ncbi:DUF6381 family protein [Streptomyces sp. NPDC002870]|uniref:DUF6381 family protein n=1 Tax=Streptomyces sp. NPDC002870 TaxID=3364666 RepID=UPI0036C7A149
MGPAVGPPGSRYPRPPGIVTVAGESGSRAQQMREKAEQLTERAERTTDPLERQKLQETWVQGGSWSYNSDHDGFTLDDRGPPLVRPGGGPALGRHRRQLHATEVSHAGAGSRSQDAGGSPGLPGAFPCRTPARP